MSLNAAAARRAFTLVELLVVISIITLLVAILVPSLARARELARETGCLSNVHSQLRGVHLYAAERDGDLVCGSANPLRFSGYSGDLPPVNSAASFQLWLGLNQQYSTHGLLAKHALLDLGVFFCPSDRDADVSAQRANLETTRDVWMSYMYRQLDGQAAGPPRTKLDDLGMNAKGVRVSALVFDAQCAIEWEDVPLKRPHGGLTCSLGFVQGSARQVSNAEQALTLQGDTNDTFRLLDAMLEAADAMR